MHFFYPVSISFKKTNVRYGYRVLSQYLDDSVMIPTRSSYFYPSHSLLLLHRHTYINKYIYVPIKQHFLHIIQYPHNFLSLSSLVSRKNLGRTTTLTFAAQQCLTEGHQDKFIKRFKPAIISVGN